MLPKFIKVFPHEYKRVLARRDRRAGAAAGLDPVAPAVSASRRPIAEVRHG